MPPPFQKRITTQGGETFMEQVYLNDVDAQDYWKFDRRGLCLKFCRVMPALWHLALVEYGGLTPAKVDDMMAQTVLQWEPNGHPWM